MHYFIVTIWKIRGKKEKKRKNADHSQSYWEISGTTLWVLRMTLLFKFQTLIMAYFYFYWLSDLIKFLSLCTCTNIKRAYVHIPELKKISKCMYSIKSLSKLENAVLNLTRERTKLLESDYQYKKYHMITNTFQP